MDALGFEQSREVCEVVTDRSALMSMTSTSEPERLTVHDNSDQKILSTFPRKPIRRYTNVFEPLSHSGRSKDAAKYLV